MNKSYRTVWNEALGAWVAASEITKARGKRSRSVKVAAVVVTACVAMGGASSDALALTLGSGVAANDTDSTAIAPTNCASPARAGAFAIAVGCEALVNAGTSVLRDIGRGVEDVVGKGTATFAVGIGSKLASGSGASNIVIGSNASATAQVGGPNANGDQIAIGNNVAVIGFDSTAIGSDIRVLSSTSIAIGNNAGGVLDGNSGGSTAIGVGSKVSNKSPGAVVLGVSGEIGFAANATAIGANAQVVGASDAVNANSGTAVGANAIVSAGSGTAVGADANVSALTGSAFGRLASVTASNGTAVGANSIVTAGSGTAVGADANVSALTGSAFGRLASVTASNGTALGASAQVSGFAGVAVGSGAVAGGKNAIALGTGAQATAEGAISIGTGNKVSGKNSGAIGDPSIIDGANSYSVGNNNSIDASSSDVFVLGNNVKVGPNLTGAVVLGSGSTAAAPVPVATNGSIAGTPYTYAGTKGVSSTVSVGAVGAERQITNVAAGQVTASSTDAINGSQLFATNQAIENINTKAGWKLGTNGGAAQKVDPSSTVTFLDGKSKNIQITQDAANNITVETAADVNFTSVTTGKTVMNDTGIAVGANVKLGDTGLTITGGPSVTSSGIDAANTKITNVADGTLGVGSKDAVNGGQLFATNQNVTNLTTTVTTINDKGTKYFHANSNGPDSTATGSDAIAVGLSAAASGLNSISMGVRSSADSLEATAIGAGAVVNGSNQGLAIGPAAQVVSSLGAVAVGGGAWAKNSDAAVAVGRAAQIADSAQSTAVGRLALITNAPRSTAIGFSTTTSAPDAVALGSNSTASGASAIAIGGNQNLAQAALASGKNAIAMGNGAQATNEGAISIGTGNVVSGKNSGAIGDPSIIDGANAYSVGNGNTLSADNAFVLGNGVTVNAGATGALVLGSGVTVPAGVTNALVLGNGAGVSANSGVAIGQGATVSSANGVALGAGSTATGATLGNQAYLVNGTASGEVSVGAAGAERRVTNVAAGSGDTDAVNVAQLRAASTQAGQGWSLSANGEATPQKIAPGDTVDFAQGSSKNVVVSRNGSKITVDTSADVNFTSVTTGKTVMNDTGIAVGPNVKLGDTGLTIAGGPSVTTSGIDAAGTKITNVADGDVSVNSKEAVNGSQLFATNQNVTNLTTTVTTINDKGTKYFHANSGGTDSKALGTDSVAIGQNAVANNANDVALGANASTAAVVNTSSAKIGNTTYNFAGTAPVGTVSVGDVGQERTITNVAAGRLSGTSTDAVNGSQLFATNQAIDAITTNAVQYDDASKTTVTLNQGGPSTKVTNVAEGDLSVNSKDAVNGSQLFATNQNVTKLGDTVTTINEQGTKYFRANSTGTGSQAIGTDAVAVGVDAVSRGDNAIAMGNGAQTGDAAVAGSGLNAIAIGNGAKAIGEGAISIGTGNVVSGKNSGAIGDPTFITGDDAYAIGNNNVINANKAFVLGNNVTVGAGLDGAVVLGNGSTVAAATATSSGTINGKPYNYAGGAPAAGDVVSVGSAAAPRQIQNVAAGQVTAASTDAINGSQLFATNQAIQDVATTAGKGWNLSANNGKSVQTIAPGGTVDFAPGSANVVVTQNGNQIVVDTVKDVSFDSVTTGQTVMNNTGIAVGPNVKLGDTGLTIAGGPSVTTTGIDAGSKVITNVAEGAVNANSKEAVNGSQLFATNQAIDKLDSNAVKYDSVNGVVDYNSVTLGGKGGTVIHNVADGVALTDAVNLSQLNNATSKWVTGNPTNYAAPSAIGQDSTAVGSGAKSSGNNSVALGNNSNDGARNNVVSVGSENGGERQVTNVAAGTKNTDAVNVGQLQGFADALGGGATVVNGTLTAPSYNVNRVEQDGKLSLQNYNNVGDALGGISYSLQNLSQDVANESSNTKYFRANSSAAGAAAVGAESTAMGPQSTAGGASAVAAGDRANASGAGSVAVGQQSKSSGASSVAIGQNAQATNTGSIAVGLNTVSSGLNTIAIGTGAVATNSVAVGAGAQAGGGSAAFGDNAMALNAMRGTALGNAATVTSTGGVALGAGAVADRAGMNGQREAVSGVAVSSTQGAVSVGSPGNERQITNVAGGTADTDAVNVRQLRAVAVEGSVRYDTNADGTTNYNQVTMGNGQAPNGTRISNVAPGVAGTDAVNMNQLNQVRGDLNDVKRNAYAGVAAAMAVQMPANYVPGKTVMRVGAGVYKGETAMGVSFRRTAENNAWSLTGGVGVSRGGVAATVGAEWVFN